MNKQNKIIFLNSNELSELITLLKSIPTFAPLIFIIALVAMNLLSRISLLSLPYLALNAGIMVSWITFLLLDVVVKHYGARAANLLSVLAIMVNLICTMLCVIVGRIWDYPWLDSLVGGQWSILLASTTAFLVSTLTNNYTNISIGRKFKNNPDGKTAFATRSFISTFISQIVDNFIFVFLAFVALPLIPSAFQLHWTLMQCIGCSVTCAGIELFSEIIFSPLGYIILKKWKQEDIGRKYLDKYCPNGVLGE